jgi:hypothetical protein
MIGQFDFSEKGWVSGSGRRAVWDANSVLPFGKSVRPQYLMSERTYFGALLDAYLTVVEEQQGEDVADAERSRLQDQTAFQEFLWPLWSRAAFMDVSSSTNARTMIAAAVPRYPAGNKVPIFRAQADAPYHAGLVSVLNSLVYDYVLRCRFGGLSLNYFILAETPLPRSTKVVDMLADASLRLAAPAEAFAPIWLLRRDRSRSWRSLWAATPSERLRLRVQMDAAVAALFGVDWEDMLWMMKDVDHPAAVVSSRSSRRFDAKGFWRPEKTIDPELRHSVLTLVAFHDLLDDIGRRPRREAVQEWLAQNDGDGWMLPEEVRLADYGLGRDERAHSPQPVRSRLGDRFFPWQLEQTAADSWEECERHARQLLGAEGYALLQSRIEIGRTESPSHERDTVAAGSAQKRLFPGRPSLFDDGTEDPV